MLIVKFASVQVSYFFVHLCMDQIHIDQSQTQNCQVGYNIKMIYTTKIFNKKFWSLVAKLSKLHDHRKSTRPLKAIIYQ